LPGLRTQLAAEQALARAIADAQAKIPTLPSVAEADAFYAGLDNAVQTAIQAEFAAKRAALAATEAADAHAQAFEALKAAITDAATGAEAFAALEAALTQTDTALSDAEKADLVSAMVAKIGGMDNLADLSGLRGAVEASGGLSDAEKTKLLDAISVQEKASNSAPTLEVSGVPYSVASGSTTLLTVIPTDPDGQKVTVSATASTGSLQQSTTDPTKWTYTAPNLPTNGANVQATITFTGTDSLGAKVTFSKVIWVIAPTYTPPPATCPAGTTLAPLDINGDRKLGVIPGDCI
jgi:hypothetical protein